MAENFGTGVSRTLSAQDHQFTSVVWQKGKPPLDSELNLIAQITSEYVAKLHEAGTPSGWIGDPCRALEDYVTSPAYSNYFKFGTQRTAEKRGFPTAVLNGWVIPVVGTHVGNPPTAPNDTDLSNKITLDPPPASAGETRIDFVFLEAWRAQLSPGGTAHKPTATGIFKFGNTEFGGTNLLDDIQDTAIGFETSERVQTQYKIRVVSGINLTNSNDGFDPLTVFGRGTDSVNTSFTFTNMRKELGDPGMWRAGDGNAANSLGTVDGYAYAIPIGVVFRRNGTAFSVSNQNGAVNRNNTATTRLDATEFINTPVLAGAISTSATSLTLTSILATGIPTNENTIRIDDEIMTYAGVSSNTLTGISRAANPQSHKAGATVTLQAMRPDGLFADQIAKDDIVDLRHIVSLENMDFQRLLQTNFNKLILGDLKTSWKRSGAAGIQGSKIPFIDRIATTSSTLGVTKLDGPDNHRVIFSDAAVLQPGNLCIASPTSGTGATTLGFDLAVTVSAAIVTPSQWSTSDVLTIPIAPQFKAGFLTGQENSVRFVLPAEVPNCIKIYVDGEVTAYTDYTVTGSVNGANPTPEDDLLITLGAAFNGKVANLHIFFALQYGPGRGLSRTPSDFMWAQYPTAPAETLVRANNLMHAEPIHLWGKVNPTGYRGALVKNAECYVDLGSKTTVVQPFRLIDVPDIRTKDGTSLNGSLGLMPVGSAPKDVVDPLNLFECHSQIGRDAYKDIYVELQKEWLPVPKVGEVFVPILPVTNATFAEGINFFTHHVEGTPLSSTYNNYVNISGGTDSQQFFTTTTNGIATAPYNRALTVSGHDMAGARKYSDASGREGIELPPFYGIARCWAVYEANDFLTPGNGSAYESTTRTKKSPASGATNLLRQNFDGAPIFIVTDVDGDSTFVLNAAAININLLATPPVNFAVGHYIVEASVFGFDRGFLTTNTRLVLSRNRTEAKESTHDANINIAVTAPKFVIPAPLNTSSQLDLMYSRVPYQGDAWGTQDGTIDSHHRAGVLTSTEILNVVNTPLDYASLLLNNQKTFEVLDMLGFYTTIGTGMLSFPLSWFSTSEIKVGYENQSSYPPGSTSDPAPRVKPLAPSSDNFDILKPSFSGMVSRLPLGSLFRDKDFLGESVFKYGEKRSFGVFPVSLMHQWLQELPTDSNFLSEAQTILGKEYTALNGAGSYITTVDGVSNNLTSTTQFRTNRGGSGYVSSMPVPGGMVDTSFGSFSGATDYSSALMVGLAVLVRNHPETVSTVERTAGDELQMLVFTSSTKPVTMMNTAVSISLQNSPSGSGEGYSAVDRFRLEGHPLIKNKTRYEPDTSAITLAKKV